MQSHERRRAQRLQPESKLNECLAIRPSLRTGGGNRTTIIRMHSISRQLQIRTVASCRVVAGRLAFALLGSLTTVPSQAQTIAEPAKAERVVSAARAQIGFTLSYDGSYRRLSYPGGDPPIETGVCTDVIIRALRKVDIDLQRAVHEDRQSHPERYPRHGAQRSLDRNIDHRRVPNLRAWMAAHLVESTELDAPGEFLPGDIVSWKLPGNLDHIGIVSDRSIDGRPLIIHNIGRGVQEEDVLLAWPRNGHFRLQP